MNNTLLQAFEWYLDADGRHWKRLISQAPEFKKLGITCVWLPPAFKCASGMNDVGYGAYDLYDLGEFRQKGTISTKYGTRKEYLQCVRTLQRKGMQVLADIVFNHRMGADETETISAVDVNPSNRDQDTGTLHQVKVWTKFTFPGRKGKYSSFIWDWTCFNGTDYDALSQNRSILLFEGKHWDPNVSKEEGNFDFVMGDDVDFSSHKVCQELYDWGKWYVNTTHINGFRLDSVKSIDSSFFNGWLQVMHLTGNHPDFAVGEYWSGDLWVLKGYLEACGHCMHLFDVPLHYHLQQASLSNGTYDIRQIFKDTLTESEPHLSVAFVDNHDTQPGQALASWVLDWFKVQAYATILLNKCEYPAVFYGDLYGIPHDHIPPVPFLREMIWIRSHCFTPNIVDLYDEDSQKACWMAWGNSPVIVLYTIADRKEKTFCEPLLADKKLINVTNPSDQPRFDSNGTITISCPGGGCSIYLTEKEYAWMHKALSR